MHEQVFSLFKEVVELEARARADYYRQHQVTDEIRDEVESLIRFDTEADSLSEDVAAAAREMLEANGHAPQPDVCGPYRVLRRIGEGGMGTVYLGERADGEVEQRVAIKVVRAAADSPSFRVRFLRERRIVASLNHPGIARMLDAGHTSAGQPYLAMEYVEGVPIDQYCAALDLRATLQLFLQACEAVAYAHRNLVIHRDLKPSNMLIDESGRLKLLDFGIARILDESEQTRTFLRALTPGYASPEQVRGEAQSTATDVYSLGAVLYRVLTRQTPRSSMSGDAPGTPSPSRIKPGIPKDVDAIVASAMRENPDDRYASVMALAEDVAAFLANRPVRARAGDALYRARKALRRYWLPATAAALVAISLGGGIVIANRERAVAERRFSDVRNLANRIFALDEEIQHVPGTTKARHKLVSVAEDYLERLSQDARRDPKLALEIGSGYLQVARVQGVPIETNLGRMADAEQSLRKADGFIDPVIARSPRNRQALFLSAEIAHDRMILAQTARRDVEATAFAQKAAARLDALRNAGGPERAQLNDVVRTYANMALAYTNMHRLDEAVFYAQRATDAARNVSGQMSAGGALILANALRYRGDLEPALETIRQARAQLENDAEVEVGRKVNLIIAVWREGRILGEEDDISLERPREAAAALETAFDMSDEIVRRDAADYIGRMRLVGAARNLADILRHTDPKRALAIYDYALARSREVKNEEAMRDQARMLAGSSYALRSLHRTAEAKQRIEAAFDLLRQLKSYPAPSLVLGQEPAVVLRALADHDAETGRVADAVRTYREILDKSLASHPAPEIDLRDANSLSIIQQRLAMLERRTGDRSAAAELDRARREMWLKWQRNLPNNGFVRRRLAEVPLP